MFGVILLWITFPPSIQPAVDFVWGCPPALRSPGPVYISRPIRALLSSALLPADLRESPLPFVVLLRFAALMSFQHLCPELQQPPQLHQQPCSFPFFAVEAWAFSPAEVTKGRVAVSSAPALCFHVVNTCCQKMAVLFAAEECSPRGGQN